MCVQLEIRTRRLSLRTRTVFKPAKPCRSRCARPIAGRYTGVRATRRAKSYTGLVKRAGARADCNTSNTTMFRFVSRPLSFRAFGFWPLAKGPGQRCARLSIAKPVYLCARAAQIGTVARATGLCRLNKVVTRFLPSGPLPQSGSPARRVARQLPPHTGAAFKIITYY